MKLKVLCMVCVLVFSLVFASTLPVFSQEKEQYYWIASVSTLPLFLTHDYPALKEEADRVGAEIHFMGPQNIDIEMQNNVLQQVMAKNPDGILFMPFGEGHNTVIDQVLDQGVPLVCIDGDAPNTNRICYSGTDWEELGRFQARLMAELIGEKGKVMLSAVIPNDNTLKARNGIEKEMEKYPNIEIVGLQNDQGSVIEAARLTAEAIQANPEINGFIGINASSGPGIARAIEEAGKVGEIKVVCVDNTPDIIEAVKKKTIQAAVVQKREAFEIWGFRVLYEYNHPSTPILQKYKDMGFPMVPKLIMTGVLVMTPDNVDQMIDVLNYQEQVYKDMGLM